MFRQKNGIIYSGAKLKKYGEKITTEHFLCAMCLEREWNCVNTWYEIIFALLQSFSVVVDKICWKKLMFANTTLCVCVYTPEMFVFLFCCVCVCVCIFILCSLVLVYSLIWETTTLGIRESFTTSKWWSFYGFTNVFHSSVLTRTVFALVSLVYGSLTWITYKTFVRRSTRVICHSESNIYFEISKTSNIYPTLHKICNFNYLMVFGTSIIMISIRNDAL